MTTARQSKKKTGKGISIGEEDKEYAVEKIVDKEVRNGEIFYLLQWAGFDESLNSWEPANNVKGLQLLPEFEREWKKKQNEGQGDHARKRRKSQKDVKVSPVATCSLDSCTSPGNGNTHVIGGEEERKSRKDNGTKEPQEMELSSSDKNGFEKGLQPEKIIGAMKSSGVLYFLIKWKEEADPGLLVSNEVAKEKCPQLVFEFYEERICWPEDVQDTE